jgi:hypothetical protein
MLEPSSGSEVGGSAPGSGGHAEAKEKDPKESKDAPLLLPPSASLHACAADGDLAALRRWLLLSQQQQQQQGQGQGQLREPSPPPPPLDAPFPEGGAWDEAEAPPPVGLTPLALAAACSDHATVDVLLAHGCDPRGGSRNSNSIIAPSPAHLAALRDPSALLSLLDAPLLPGGAAESQLLHARDGTCVRVCVRVCLSFYLSTV